MTYILDDLSLPLDDSYCGKSSLSIVLRSSRKITAENIVSAVPTAVQLSFEDTIAISSQAWHLDCGLG